MAHLNGLRYNFYHYTPLATYEGSGAHKEFRILTILPGSGYEIECMLTHYPLPEAIDQPASVRYEALSWTWGEPRDDIDEIIIKDDLKGARLFPVRKNLSQALRHLRYATKPREIWVDFVCINQQDLVERAAHVKLMFFIYGKASNVCVWLGMHAHNSDLAFKFVKEEVNDLSKWNVVTEERSKERWTALAALMERPWFSRRWVVQELALAVKASVHCGDVWLDWTEFETAVALFDREADRLRGFYQGSRDAYFDADSFGDVGQMGATRLVHLKSNLFRLDENHCISEYRCKLVELVSNLWSFDAQDPHDVIYAVLSIAKDTYDRVNVAPNPREQDSLQRKKPIDMKPTNGIPLTGDSARRAASVVQALKQRVAHRTIFNIDYSQDFFVVCKQFLAFAIPTTEHHNLDILLRPWAPYQNRNRERLRLPSWIPTVEGAAFRRQDAKHAPGGYQMLRQNCDALVAQITLGSRSSPYNAGQSARALPDQWQIFEGPDDFRFRVTGFVVDRIADIQDASQFGNVAEDWLVLAGWDKKSHNTSNTLWRTLVADRGPEGRNTMPYYQKAFEQAIADSAQGINTSLLKNRGHPVLAEFLRRVEAIVTNRKLFKSKREKVLGLAPKKAKDGDFICIIQGMSVPAVLRPVEEAEHYTLIGECYLHTMMDGHAIDIREKQIQEHHARIALSRQRITELQGLAKEVSLSEENSKRMKQLLRHIETDQREIALLSSQVFELQ